MMSASENRRSRRPYIVVPMIPPIAIAVVSRPNPTALIWSRSWAYRTSTDQAAPNVTLNATIVMNSVRIGGWSASQRMPSAMSARQSARLALGRGLRHGRVATRVMSSAPSAKQAAFVANGRAMPTTNRNAPIGGATSWLVSSTPPWRRAFAMPRSSRRTSRGRMLPPPTSANVSAVPRRNSATRTSAMLTAPVTIVAASRASTTRPGEVDDDDDPDPVDAVRDDAGREAEEQHRDVLGQDRHRDEQRVARLATRPAAARPPARRRRRCW